MASTPTLDRMHEVKDRSQEIGEFLDWLTEDKGVALHVWWEGEEEDLCSNFDCRDGFLFGNPKNPCSSCNGTGLVMRHRERWMPFRTGGHEKILAEYFGIDLDKAEGEKRAILEEVRAMNAS
jgi:hypothetical protein